MTRSTNGARRSPVADGAFVVVGGAITIPLEVAAGRGRGRSHAPPLTFPAVGFFVLSRRPDARLGWLMVSMGVARASGCHRLRRVRDPARAAARAARRSRSAGRLGAVHRHLRLPVAAVPRRSPPVAPLAVARVGMRHRAGAGGGGASGSTPVSFTDSGFPEMENPMGIDALGPVLDVPRLHPGRAPAWCWVALASLFVRMRRTTDDVVRHQIRWLAYVAAWIAAIFGSPSCPRSGTTHEWTGVDPDDRRGAASS